MLVLALLAPIAALLLCLLLVFAILHAFSYAGLYNLVTFCFGADLRRRPVEPVREIQVGDVKHAPKISSCVLMHGLQVEAEPGLCVKDDTTPDQEEVLQLFRTHGNKNSNIYTVFSNPEMQVFLVRGLGCIPYTKANHWCATVVCAVGDPVCEPQHALQVMQLFQRTFPSAIFIDMKLAAARLLADQGAAEGGPTMAVNDMGLETVIDVQKYNIAFNKKTKQVRKRADGAARAGLIVEEVTAHSNAGIKAQVAKLASDWQQGKECTDDIKVFSRAIPFEHLGRESDVRVFIARTLAPGEVPPLTVPEVAAAWERKLAEGRAAAAAKGDAPKLSRKQRQLIARVQHAKTLRQKSGSVTSGSSAAASSSAAGDAASDTGSSDTQQQGDQLQQRQLSTAMTSSASSTDLTAVIEPTRNSLRVASSTAVSKHGNASSVCSTAGSVTTAAAKDRDGDRNSSGGSRVHACVVLDPIYSEGRIMGYLAERSFLCPRGESGAVKLVLRDVLGLLKAEGRQVLNLGLAVAHEVKSGAHHGFDDCAWMTRNMRLCCEYGNDLYAFQNLADAKASWGGGYDSDTDSYKYSEAVRLNRRFVVLPRSWKTQLGHGPFLMAVVFRHVGALGDPWDLPGLWQFFKG